MRAVRAWIRVAAALGLAVPAIGGANEPAQPSAVEPEPDSELLEFLGSIDDADEDWAEYLMRTDIAKIARAKRTVAPQDGEHD